MTVALIKRGWLRPHEEPAKSVDLEETEHPKKAEAVEILDFKGSLHTGGSFVFIGPGELFGMLPLWTCVLKTRSINLFEHQNYMLRQERRD